MSSLLQLARINLSRVTSAPHIPFLKGDSEVSPAKQLAENARRFGKKVAIIFEDQRITYAEFDRQATRYARAAVMAGLKKGDIAAVLMENRPEYLFLTYGLSRIGVTAALINTNLTGRPLKHVLEASGMKALFVGAECLSHLESIDHEIPVPWSHVFVERSEDPEAELPHDSRDVLMFADTATKTVLNGVPINKGLGDDWLCFIYTSGTTGLPKAGRVPNVRYFGGGYAIGGAACGCNSYDTVYCCLPLYHASAFILGCSFAFLHGGTLALARKFSASRFWDDVRKTESTVFLYIGELCRYLAAQPPKPDDNVHKLRAMTGNGMRPEIWKEFVTRFGVEKVHEFYAATEGNANMVNLDGTLGAVGQLNLLTRFVYNTILVKWDPLTEQPVRDAKGFCIECDVNEPGEMLGKIDPKKVNTRFDGYADPSSTEKKILRHVLERGDSYFRTGDLLRRDEKGYYYFVDRIGDTFRWKGENVSTNEVADVLTQHPQIEVANVYGVTVAKADGRAGMATINTRGGVALDGKSVFDFVQRNLPDYGQPLFLRIQPQAELTGTFKLRKVDLQKEGFDPGVVADPLFFRDLDAKSYVPLTPELYKRILAGTSKL
jgi:fatty-acyl-CoA synthase